MNKTKVTSGSENSTISILDKVLAIISADDSGMYEDNRDHDESARIRSTTSLGSCDQQTQEDYENDDVRSRGTTRRSGSKRKKTYHSNTRTKDWAATTTTILNLPPRLVVMTMRREKKANGNSKWNVEE
jgi:hypothetical protein